MMSINGQNPAVLGRGVQAIPISVPDWLQNIADNAPKNATHYMGETGTYYQRIDHDSNTTWLQWFTEPKVWGQTQLRHPDQLARIAVKLPPKSNAQVDTQNYDVPNVSRRQKMYDEVYAPSQHTDYQAATIAAIQKSIRDCAAIQDEKTAGEYLENARKEMEDRAKTYDAPTGERSMAKTVAAFNLIYGTELTEVQGWQFMSLLKKVRQTQGAYREDSYVDDVAYAALAAEAANQSQGSSD